MKIQQLILPVFAISSTLTESVLSVHVPSSFSTSNRFSQILFGVAQPDIWDVMKKGAPALQKYALDLFQSAASTAGALAPRVNEIKSLVGDVFDEVTHLHGQINMSVQASGSDGETLDRISEEIDQGFQRILHQLAREFPPTDQAASHDERTQRVADLLEKAREALVPILCEKHHLISEADFMHMWSSPDNIRHNW
ncbi:hypothetical protein ONZ45_g12044 [Pleurotus djamor]|nr:hypothetical protein ONZ45_g12044 [Pleurotus djamor]